MSDPACLSAALDYAKRGWRVLALSPGMKIPLKDNLLQPNGSTSATTDPEHIRKLWGLYPLANVGIATGKESNLTVVDFDGPEAQQALTAVGLRVPKTRIVKTRKGYHVYLAYDPDLKQGARLMPALDIRNDGGYVVAPPSVVDGVTYVVFKDNPLGEWPELTGAIAKALADKQHQKPASDIQHPGWVSELIANGAPEGQRNDAASRLAGYFRSINIPQDIAFASLLGFARVCQPPMAEGELQAIVTSVWRYVPSKALTYQGTVVSAPNIDASITTRRLFQWPHEGINVRLDRLREDREGIHCWIEVSVAGLGDIYGPVGFNLLADRSRTSLAKSLKDRYEANWLAILDVIAKEIVHGITKQGTSEDAASIVPDREAQWLAHPFLKARQATLLYADGGTGKSTFSVAIAMSLAMGQSLIPGVKIERPVACLYLDWEGSRDEFATMREALERAHNIKAPASMLRYRKMAQALPDELDTILRETTEWGIQAVMVDSIVGAAGADVIEAEAARLHYGCLAQIGVASLNLTHISNAGRGEGGAVKPYGSVFYWNYARSVWHARRDHEANAIAMYHRKSNYSKLHPTLAWQTETTSFTDDTLRSLRYISTNVQDSKDLAVATTQADQIAGILRGVWLTAEAIAEETGIPGGNVRSVLRRGKKSGRFTQDTATNAWGLPVPRDMSRDASQPRDVTGAIKPPVTELSQGKEKKRTGAEVSRTPYPADKDDDDPPWEVSV